MKYFFITAFMILLLAIILSIKHKEGFLENLCPTYTTCGTCAAASGCSWCPANKTCIQSTSLKSTDPQCNQMNTINSSFSCAGDETDSKDSNASNDVMYDFTLYKNRITDRIPPPNVYTNSDMEYSPETVMGAVNHLEQDLYQYQQGLPGIIASSMENQIGPMVKGVLGNNYYIQQ